MVEIIRGDRVCKRGRLAVGCSAAVLGGYMEPGETFTETCAREVLET